MTTELSRVSKRLSVTRSCIGHFERSISRLKVMDVPSDTDPIIWDACIRSMESQLESLSREEADLMASASGRHLKGRAT